MKMYLLFMCFGFAHCCSNLLVPAGSTVDKSTIITYSTDNPGRFGDVVNWPAGKHEAGELREIYDFDSGLRLGAIPEAPVTYNVVSQTNEHQLSIGETTFGGLAMLDGSHGGPDFGPGRVIPVCNKTYGCVDYGSIIYLTLQRARNAREAISVVDELAQTYGYASSGESFSIADPQEVWLMEIIGKGNISQGAVWVATRIPDGAVSAHANQARTRTFSWNDTSNVRYAKDVASFARDIGVYNGEDEDFSFSDVYDPVTFEGARFCEARVYSFFKAVAASEEHIQDYLDYVQGYNLTNRMPLYIKVAKPLDVKETMWHMRNHYEDTWLDHRSDVGAQEFNSPYRIGEPLTWKYAGDTYVNERMIGVEKAAINIVANGRPKHKFGVLWFGVDDSTFSVHTPLYGSTTRLPKAWDGGNCTGRAACREAFGLPGTISKFSTKAMHWVGQLVANYAYTRYSVIAPVVYDKLKDIEGRLLAQVDEMDQKLDGMETSEAIEAATNFSYTTAEQLHLEWLDFYGTLFATYVDGYTTVPDPKNHLGGVEKKPFEPDDKWKKRIVTETGSHYRVPKELLGQRSSHLTINKLQLASLGGIEHRPILQYV